MAVALQRKNFRCPLGSPSKNTSGRTNANLVISHAEFPPRVRKRVHVGSTNLSMSKSISTPDLMTLDGNSSSSTMSPDVASATRKLCETNIELMKLSLELPPSIMSSMLPDHSNNNYKNRRPRLKSLSELEATHSVSSTPSSAALSSPSSVIRTRQRRLLTPSASEKRLKPMRLVHTSHGFRSPSSFQLETSPEQNHSNNNSSSSSIGYQRSEKEGNGQGQVQQGRGYDPHMHANRKKMYETFMKDYGSLHAVFRAFDTEGNGLVTFERFKEKIQQSDHEQVNSISEEDLHTLFQVADTGGKRVVEYDRFCELFAATEDQIPSPFKPTNQMKITNDPTTSIPLKYCPQIQLSPRKTEAVRRLQTRLTSQIESKHGHQIHIHGGNDKFLIHAFKQFDEDGNGAVTSNQIKQALGEGYLKLDIEPHEVDEMIHLIHPPLTNGTTQEEQEISMKEFVRYFGLEQCDGGLYMLEKGKRNELASLEAKFQAPFPTRQEIDPEYGMALLSPSSRNQKLPSLETDTTTDLTCMQEMLSKRIAASFEGANSPSPSPLRSNNKSAASGAKSPLMTPSQDRFIHTRNERTDWTRVGFGGDGIRPETALYISEMDRFRTTTAEQYSPFDAHGRRSRKGVDVEMKAIEDAYQLKHYQRTEQNLKNIERHRDDQLRIKAWKDQAKIRRFAHEKYEYLDRLHNHDQKLLQRENGMQKRHGGADFLRMWAGSPDSQFNARNLTTKMSNEEEEKKTTW